MHRSKIIAPTAARTLYLLVGIIYIYLNSDYNMYVISISIKTFTAKNIYNVIIITQSFFGIFYIETTKMQT